MKSKNLDTYVTVDKQKLDLALKEVYRTMDLLILEIERLETENEKLKSKKE